MDFPDSYFEDEVRDGFYVSSLMKRAWASSLEVLNAVAEICEKNGIEYFLEWGALLGAIRHGGFIPWDDDIDICMTNQNFKKFIAIMKSEYKEEFDVVDFWSDVDNDNMVVGIRNSERVLVKTNEHLEKYHGYPYISGLDLFRLDYIPANPLEENDFRYVLIDVAALITMILHKKRGGEEVTDEDILKGVRHIEELCRCKIDREKDIKQQLYEIFEERIAYLYDEWETKEVTHLSLYLNVPTYRMPKSYFKESVLVEYENTKLRVPAYYDALLNNHKYSNYMNCVRAGGSHAYPYYRNLEKQLTEKYDFYIHHYEFSREEMEGVERIALPETLQNQIAGFLPLFSEAHESILSVLQAGEYGQAMDVLAECQDMAVQVGTVVEEERGGGQPTVSLLEQYCEMVYQFYESIASEESVLDSSVVQTMRDSFAEFEKKFSESIERDLKKRKEIVFVPYKASLWPAMDSVWQKAVDAGDADVYVIPAPYYYKDEFQRIKREEPHYETEGYPDYVTLTSYENYNFEVHHPETIVIQCPYDEYNYGFTIHSFFYAKNLKQYTDELVYIPAFVMDEIGPGDERARIMLKEYVNMPGVVHADKVIVQSEQMKQVYVELLTEFAGEDTKEIWENKISGEGSPVYEYEKKFRKEDMELPAEWMEYIRKPDGSWKKVLLYTTSASALLGSGEKMLQKMEENFALFRERQDELTVLWRPDPNARDMLRRKHPGLWNGYRELVEKFQKEKVGIYDISQDRERAMKLCDACYGDGGVTLNKCCVRKKPTMWQKVF